MSIRDINDNSQRQYAGNNPKTIFTGNVTIPFDASGTLDTVSAVPVSLVGTQQTTMAGGCATFHSSNNSIQLTGCPIGTYVRVDVTVTVNEPANLFQRIFLYPQSNTGTAAFYNYPSTVVNRGDLGVILPQGPLPMHTITATEIFRVGSLPSTSTPTVPNFRLVGGISRAAGGNGTATGAMTMIIERLN